MAESNYGRSVFPSMIIVDNDVTYDLTSATAGITQMMTALASESGYLLFDGEDTDAYRCLEDGFVYTEEEGENNNQGHPKITGKTTLTVMALDEEGATTEAKRAALRALRDGDTKNVYLFDQKSALRGLVQPMMNVNVKYKRTITAGKAEYWMFELMETEECPYDEKVLPHTYTA